MRITRWSSFLLLPVAIALVAAAAPAGAVEGGFKVGLSVATLHGSLPTDGLVENSPKLGFGGGAWLAIPLGPTLSVQPELNYVQKGTSLGSVELTDPGGITLGTIKVLAAVDYLEMPLLLRVSIPVGGSASPYFVGGPVAGFRLSQKIKVSGIVSYSTDAAAFRGTDFGAALGAGLELGHGPMRGTFETRYTLGLTPAGQDSYSTDAKNGDFMVTMGLAIRR